MSDLATRAERFEQVLVPSGSPRGASVRPDGLSRTARGLDGWCADIIGRPPFRCYGGL